MPIELNISDYRAWMTSNIMLSDPFAPDSLKRLVIALIMGKNYRLLTEENTKKKLITTYAWLAKVLRNARQVHGTQWREQLLEQLIAVNRPTREEKQLMLWLLGLTDKTAKNLDIQKEDFPDFLRETIAYCNELFQNIGDQHTIVQDDIWLLLMGGSATLNIRGSQKSKIGKAIEKVFLKASLSLLGFDFEENFWLNIAGDIEVDRETDAEIQTRRGRIRIEVGLISEGNPEVIRDKIGRVGDRGVILFDKVGTHSTIYETARLRNVKLIQIRHNQPLIELRRHLEPLVTIPLNQIPDDEASISRLVNALPENMFIISA